MSANSSPFKHVVVLMLENRSFDNVLGWMEGTTQYTNPNPFKTGETISSGSQTEPTQINGAGTSYAATTIPLVDPGETFGDMAQQIMGTERVPDKNPYGDSYQPNMNGFTLNYKDKAEEANIADVMNQLTEDQLPVTAFLASHFGVCQNWHASVPTQTFTNRAFAFCAAPAVSQNTGKSLIDDVQYGLIDSVTNKYKLPSIVQQLDLMFDQTPVNWKVYFHDYSIAMWTVPYIYNAAQSKENVNVATFDTSDWGGNLPKHLGAAASTFIDDVTAKPCKLPKFSFIEPRYSRTYAAYSHPPNSNHPGGSDSPPTAVTDSNPPIDIVNGELFLAQVYNLLRASDVWDETLFIVTYDEHGGIYDHVTPPTATPPGTINWPAPGQPPNTPSTIPEAHDDGDRTSKGFNFNVYGGRVPAIIVSRLTTTGSANDGSLTFDHASIVKTVWDIFNLSASPSTTTSLNDRDANAPSVAAIPAAMINETSFFAGAIPAALFFSSASPAKQMLYATTGSNATISASITAGSEWMSISQATVTGENTTTLGITISVTPGDVAQKGEIQITGIGTDPISVPVTLIVD